VEGLVSAALFVTNVMDFFKRKWHSAAEKAAAAKAGAKKK
jgi:hypothetical protein